MDPQLLALGGLWYVAFLLSLTCHEAAHALVALRGGDDTAAAGGQVSLNPLPHVRREPLGTIAVPNPHISRSINGCSDGRRLHTAPCGSTGTPTARAGWLWPDRERTSCWLCRPLS